MASPEAERWARARTFHHSQFAAAEIARSREVSISACVPARECEPTIAGTVGVLRGLVGEGVLDEVVVVAAPSRDRTVELAAAAGATVHDESALLPEQGPVRGKGDAMRRALSVIDADVVCFLDGDNESFGAHYACGLLGPLVLGPEHERISLVKAFYRRPFRQGGISLPDGGGRVNRLTARPALALFYPELAGVRQPLAGEVAARRELLDAIELAPGYGVEIAMLIDIHRHAGIDAIAQVDLGEHHNAHQPLSALSSMSYEVLLAIARRLERDGRLRGLEPGGLLEATGT